jgi:hypothetical protein
MMWQHSQQPGVDGLAAESAFAVLIWQQPTACGCGSLRMWQPADVAGEAAACMHVSAAGESAGKTPVGAALP